MTFDLFMVWSDLCPSCCCNTGRLLHGICKYAVERSVAHGPHVILQRKQNLAFHLNHLLGQMIHMKFHALLS